MGSLARTSTTVGLPARRDASRGGQFRGSDPASFGRYPQESWPNGRQSEPRLRRRTPAVSCSLRRGGRGVEYPFGILPHAAQRGVETARLEPLGSLGRRPLTPARRAAGRRGGRDDSAVFDGDCNPSVHPRPDRLTRLRPQCGRIGDRVVELGFGPPCGCVSGCRRTCRRRAPSSPRRARPRGSTGWYSPVRRRRCRGSFCASTVPRARSRRRASALLVRRGCPGLASAVPGFSSTACRPARAVCSRSALMAGVFRRAMPTG